ncbi:cell cycle control protein 50B [Amia ocellicauda]|uniref:cell cycle control protein 50B n=1 Tax=Amia ocellicauda TaxID=2972642 RepID=UPI003464C1F4
MAKEGETPNKPDNTAFTQQRLPAWQPILSAGIVIPGFLVIGLAFIAIGVALFITSSNIQVLEMDYTGNTANSPCAPCTNNATQNCKCSLNFTLSTKFEGPVYMYYGLSNFYQNFRRYGVSRDDNQLFGVSSSMLNPVNNCAPFDRDAYGTPIAPCGAIANSFFNDTFVLFHNDTGRNIPLDGNGIAWWTDYNIKFRNPGQINGNLTQAFQGTVKPLNWPKPAYDLDTNLSNNGFLNQDFLVWMRTAALPDFRKLYRRISDTDYASGLPAGNYSLEISYNFPVLSFQGHKKVVFSNVSWMGGQNQFLGIAYLVIGCLCIVMSVIMLIVYAKFQIPDEDL